MASRTGSILGSALLTLCLLIDLHFVVEARDSMFFSKFNGNEYTPNAERTGANGYQANYGTDGVRDVSNGYGSQTVDRSGYGSRSGTAYEESDKANEYSPKAERTGVNGYRGNYGTDGVRDGSNGYGSESGDRVGYGSGSGTANQESKKPYFAGSYGAYGSDKADTEGTGAGRKEDTTNTVPSFENAEGQQNGGVSFGNGYGAHSTPYRNAGSRDELGTVYGSSASRYGQNDKFASGYGVRTGSNSGYDSSYKADSGYGRKFDHDVYTPGTRVYDRNAYSSNSGTGGRYEQTESRDGKYVGGTRYEQTESGYAKYVGGGN